MKVFNLYVSTFFSNIKSKEMFPVPLNIKNNPLASACTDCSAVLRVLVLLKCLKQATAKPSFVSSAEKYCRDSFKKSYLLQLLWCSDLLISCWRAATWRFLEVFILLGKKVLEVCAGIFKWGCLGFPWETDPETSHWIEWPGWFGRELVSQRS